MTLLVRDEEDIVGEVIAYHLACGVDHIVATDNRSLDGTLDILREYERSGRLTLLREDDEDFAQAKWVTRMAVMAREKFGADWILNCDADEFWMTPNDDLKAILAQDMATTSLVCPVLNMITAYEDLGTDHWSLSLRWRVTDPIRLGVPPRDWRQPLPAPFYYLEFGSKALIRAEGLISVAQGNHRARHEQSALDRAGDVAVYHYSLRSREEFERNTRHQGSAYANNAELHWQLGWQKRRWFAMMNQPAGLEIALADALPDRARLERDSATGDVMFDERPRLPLERLGIVSAVPQGECLEIG